MAILELVTRGLELSDVQLELVHEKMSHFVGRHPNIVACRLLLGASQRRYRPGQRCRARVAIAIPGQHVIVTRRGCGDPFELVEEALDAAASAVGHRLPAPTASDTRDQSLLL